MAPDSTPTLRESMTPRPSPRPRCDTPPRLAVVDAVDAHHSFSCLHHLVAAPKTMPQEVQQRRKRRHRPIRDTQSGVSPGAAQEHLNNNFIPSVHYSCCNFSLFALTSVSLGSSSPSFICYFIVTML
jgi:hypothetical protein